MQMMPGDMFSVPSSIKGLAHQEQDPNVNPKPISNPSLKKKRNLPGNPDPDAEVIALSPKTLMATNRFICEICNKGFQRDQNLQLHRRGHNLPWKLKQRSNKEVIRKKVYICPENTCVHHDPSRALGDLTGIKKHFSRKHGEKKWKCEKCSKKYAVQSDWKAHSKTCGTREYKCDCGTLFSRKDSFITHRAFCDALAEESVRFNSVASNHLNFTNDTSNETVINPQPNMGHAFCSTISQFGSDFRSDYSEDQQKPRLSLWLDQANSQLNPIDISGNSNMYMSSSSNNLPDMVQMGTNNVFCSSSLGVNNIGNETLASSLYSDNHNYQAKPSGPMSATALLQKAAQMGSTRSSSPSVFGNMFGVMTSSAGQGIVGNTSNIMRSSVPNSLDQVIMQTRVTQGEAMPAVRLHPGLNSAVQNSMTRDFLGMGGEGGRPLFPQELAKFASMGSAMGLSQFTSNH